MKYSNLRADSNSHSVEIRKGNILTTRKISSVRWPVLVFTSIVCFSTDYFYDVPNVLHDRFIYISTVCQSGRKKCLHLTACEFDLLQAVYAWFGACIVPFPGFWLTSWAAGGRSSDSGFFFLGSDLFSYSTHLENEQTALILMLLGRLIFGNVTNFLFTANLADVIGLRSTLWLGTVLCEVGLIGVAGAGYYHTIGLREIGRDAGAESNEPLQVVHPLDRHYGP
ncbi:hypothetical protein BV898_12331 [Hypsibius exemplaris]|uniref:Uncharacterized protein n=1 Tax=Hypsibius exemplaris TaxID=2072580 RepID=A0A1W0WE53_HYPEX|nr:hypothetical protein BV898_12331 [Hypsibius exemplaris]